MCFNLSSHLCLSVFIRVHQWLQSVVPFCVHPCSSVVAICGSIGVHPRLSVFISGCNLWFHWCPSVFIRVHQWLQSVVPFCVHRCSSVVAICGSIGVYPCLSVFISGCSMWFDWCPSVFIRVHQWLLSVVPFCVHPCSSVVAICGSIGVHPCLSVFISGCNLWFHWCPSVFIRVHQWLQSVVPLVSIRVYLCSSVVAICGSNGVHPCVSVFISGCNLWFHLFPSVFILVHHWLQSVVPLVSIRLYSCSSVVAICGSIGVHPCLSVFISGCNLWFQWCPSVFIRVHQWLQSVVPMVSIRVYPCSSVVAICGSNGFHPCLSVFISGCNLWLQSPYFRRSASSVYYFYFSRNSDLNQQIQLFFIFPCDVHCIWGFKKVFADDRQSIRNRPGAKRFGNIFHSGYPVQSLRSISPANQSYYFIRKIWSGKVGRDFQPVQTILKTSGDTSMIQRGEPEMEIGSEKLICHLLYIFRRRIKSGINQRYPGFGGTENRRFNPFGIQLCFYIIGHYGRYRIGLTVAVN